MTSPRTIEARSWLARGDAFRYRLRWDDAAIAYGAAIRVAGGTNDSACLGLAQLATRQLALSWYKNGNVDAAKATWYDLAECRPAIATPEGLACKTASLMDLACEDGDPARALAYCARAIHCGEQNFSPVGLAWLATARFWRGNIHVQDRNQSRSDLASAFAHGMASRHPDGYSAAAGAALSLGLRAAIDHQKARAVIHFEQAVVAGGTSPAARGKRHAAWAANHLAALHLEAGRPSLGVVTLQRAIQIGREGGEPQALEAAAMAEQSLSRIMAKESRAPAATDDPENGPWWERR